MQNRARRALDKEYEMLLDALGFEPATFDSLAAGSRLLRHTDRPGRGASRRTAVAAWWPNRFALTTA
jgi:hypothetical protein